MISQTKILVLLFVLLLMAGSVYAMVPEDGGAREGFKAHYRNRLNLTPEQKTKLQALGENFRKETVFYAMTSGSNGSSSKHCGLSLTRIKTKS